MINSSTLEKTICAISTAPGSGGVAIIRVSGKDAINIVNPLFSKNLDSTPSNKAVFGKIVKNKNILDEVIITLFKSPNSYTGEDIVEIACHGSIFIQQSLLEVLINNGCSIAGPGEFTMRAYLNGKMDLSQAEAVGDLIASKSSASHKLAITQMRGGFSKKIKLFKQKLIDFASLIELEIDFSEEDVEFANRKDLFDLLKEVYDHVSQLKDSFQLGNVLKNGVPVAIVGSPNVGKSTLLNTLLNEDKAIVSDIAGTTRDTIEDVIIIEGITFRFIDTAGIRKTKDSIENMGIERSFQKAETALINLLLVDGTNFDLQSFKSLYSSLKKNNVNNKHIIVLVNKADKITDKSVIEEQLKKFTPLLFLSAKEGKEIDNLKNILVNCIDSQKTETDLIVSNARHFEALSRAYDSLKQAIEGMKNGLSGDLIALDIRQTLHYLSEIIGEISTEDLLGNIFGKFCIGK